MKFRFLRPARQELADAIDYYNLQQAGLGDIFRNEAWATLQCVRGFPLAWQALGGSIRRCQMQRFPYGVIYEPKRQRSSSSRLHTCTANRGTGKAERLACRVQHGDPERREHGQREALGSPRVGLMEPPQPAA